MEEQNENMIKEAKWEAVVDYIEKRMDRIREVEDGKFSRRGEELWSLKKAMSEVDSNIQNVGKTWNEYENEIYGGNK